MVLLTGKPYEIVKVEWSGTSWTHNIFRFYESIFGRRAGIRLEITSTFDGTQARYYAHTFEGACALVETSIRNAFKFKLVKVYLPVLSLNTGNFGFPQKQSYMFAIAYDTFGSFGDSMGSDPHNWSHTCTGSNLALVVSGGATKLGSPGTWTATYNNVSTTSAYIVQNNGFNPWIATLYLKGPATGSHTVSFAINGTQGSGSFVGISSSYSGVDQTITLGATGTDNAGVAATIITTYNNSMLVDFDCLNSAGTTLTPGSGQTKITQLDGTGADSFVAGASYRLVGTAGSYNAFWNTGGRSGVLELKAVATANGNMFLVM